MTSLRLLTAVALFQAPLLHAVESWPQFRGPDGQGVIEGPSPQNWSKTDKVVWKTPVAGEGWSSPVILDGKLILTASEEDDGKTALKAIAFDTKNGKLIWSTQLFTPTEAELSARHPKNSLASSTPAIADGTVYVHFGHMGTAALDLGSGKVLWKRKLSYKPMHGNGSSPVVLDDMLIIHADAEESPAIYALSRKDGSTVWRTPREQEVRRSFSFSTPLVVKNGDRTEIISPASGMVGAYAPKDGKLLWKVEYGEGFSLVPRPVTADGIVYVTTGFMKPKLLAIRLKGAEGNVTESHVEWTVTRRIPKTPSVIVSGKQVIVLDDSGFLSGFSVDEGKELWREKLVGNFSSSPLLCGDTLYCFTEDGIAYVLKVSEKGVKTTAEIDMGERLFASPAVVDGALYIRSEGHLWKVGG